MHHNCGTYYKSNHNITKPIITKPILKRLWNKYANNKIKKIKSSSGIYKAIYIIMVAFCLHLKKENDKVKHKQKHKFHSPGTYQRK